MEKIWGGRIRELGVAAVRDGFTVVSKYRKEVREEPYGYLREKRPICRGNSQCKGPEAGVYLVCLSISEEGSMSAAD